jgi:hypothetical protein
MNNLALQLGSELFEARNRCSADGSCLEPSLLLLQALKAYPGYIYK